MGKIAKKEAVTTNLHFDDLVKEGQSTATLQTRWYLDLERYRRGSGFQKDGFGTWTECLEKLLVEIRRSRSGVMAKLAQVRLLLDSKKVSFEQLERIGDANATMLCRLYRVKGLSKVWIERALEMPVEKFREAVLKAVKPDEEPKRRLTFVLTQSVYVKVEQMIGRLQTLLKADKKAEDPRDPKPSLPTRELVLEFVAADYADRDDADILHSAGEIKP